MWHEIPNISKIYKVNKDGIFINVETGRILKGEQMDKGYIRMHLKSTEGKSIRVMAHRLVALTFIGEPPTEQHQVNHINSIKSDNRVKNLEWVTVQENINHKMENMNETKYKNQQKLMSDVGKEYGYINGKNSAKSVMRICQHTGDILQIYESARDASKLDGFSYKNISQVCRGEKKTHKGYIWRFVE